VFLLLSEVIATEERAVRHREQSGAADARPICLPEFDLPAQLNLRGSTAAWTASSWNLARSRGYAAGRRPWWLVGV